MIAGMSWYAAGFVVVAVAGMWMGWRARKDGGKSYEPGAGAVKLGRM